MEPGERKTTDIEMKHYLIELLNRENAMIFVVEDNRQLVGFLSAIGGTARRNYQTVYIVIGILESFTGKGIGKALFMETEKWAKEIGIHRLELGLMASNERALRLYTTLGFVQEGRKPEVFLVDGTYIDEIMMGKLIS
jgi:RimJ/RimL family protein N-acetyltransferase